MGQYGLRIPDDERKKIVQYLVTYLGPNPPKAAPPSGAPSPAVDGAAMYARQCSACHQAQGGGLPGTFPPLAGNHDLYRDRMFPVYVLLNGLEGAITVKGESYNGVMPPFDHLSDAEIAAVVGYVRAAWNNAEAAPVGFRRRGRESGRAGAQKPMKPEGRARLPRGAPSGAAPAQEGDRSGRAQPGQRRVALDEGLELDAGVVRGRLEKVRLVGPFGALQEGGLDRLRHRLGQVAYQEVDPAGRQLFPRARARRPAPFSAARPAPGRNSA